jgi:hypothetical protein
MRLRRLVAVALLLAGLVCVLPLNIAVEARQTLTWTDVTESGMATLGTDDFGPQTIFVNPTDHSKVYVATDHHGFWRSTDYGQNFTHYNTTTYLDTGKIWAGHMAPDASYMLLGLGNGSTTCTGSTACAQYVHRSTDGGLTWTAIGGLPGGGTCDPYSYDISSSSVNHVLASCHGSGTIYESTDGGLNWASIGTPDTDASPFVQFLGTDSTILVTYQGDNCSTCIGAFRGVKSGSWSFTRVLNAAHFHGAHQLFVDTTNSRIILPTGQGLYTSSDDGQTWTQRDGNFTNTAICTTAWCYSGYGYPNQGSYGPGLRSASRSSPTTWSTLTAPGGMVNGPARWATLCHAGTQVVMSVNRNAGVWRGVTGESCTEPGGGGGGGGGNGGGYNRRRLRIIREPAEWLADLKRELAEDVWAGAL